VYLQGYELIVRDVSSTCTTFSALYFTIFFTIRQENTSASGDAHSAGRPSTRVVPFIVQVRVRRSCWSVMYGRVRVSPREWEHKEEADWTNRMVWEGVVRGHWGSGMICPATPDHTPSTPLLSVSNTQHAKRWTIKGKMTPTTVPRVRCPDV